MEGVEQIVQEVETISKLFYRIEVNAATRQLNTLAELIDVYIQAQEGASLDGELIQELNEQLGLIMNCLSNQDYILVADLLRYEVVEILRRLSKVA